MKGKRFQSVATAFAAAALFLLASCVPPALPSTADLDDGASRGTGTCTAGSFSVSFSNASFVTGLGWSTGSTSRTIGWSGSCSNCDWGPGVYGWMQNPLIEYYIPRTASGTTRGTYTADGRTYTLITHTQVNQPSIEGTKTFEQYFASGSNSGSVAFGQHVTGWQKYVPIGSQNYQVVAVESWSGDTGSASVSVPSSNWYTHWIGSGTATFTCGTGTVTPPPTGGNTIVVRARGTSGAESVQLTVNGSTVGTWTVSTSYTDRTFTTSLTGGTNVYFTNDASGRDVQIDYITVNGSIRQAENQSTNTGAWDSTNSKCGKAYSEWLHCNGYIGFGNTP